MSSLADSLIDQERKKGGPKENKGDWMAGSNGEGLVSCIHDISLFRYTFGAALFVGWVAGGLTLIGGVMMCIACRGLTPDDSK